MATSLKMRDKCLCVYRIYYSQIAILVPVRFFISALLGWLLDFLCQSKLYFDLLLNLEVLFHFFFPWFLHLLNIFYVDLWRSIHERSLIVILIYAGKAVSKFCAKYLHQQVLKQEAYSAGDLGTSLRKAFLRFPYSFDIICHSWHLANVLLTSVKSIKFVKWCDVLKN